MDIDWQPPLRRCSDTWTVLWPCLGALLHYTYSFSLRSSTCVFVELMGPLPAGWMHVARKLSCVRYFSFLLFSLSLSLFFFFWLNQLKRKTSLVRETQFKHFLEPGTTPCLIMLMDFLTFKQDGAFFFFFFFKGQPRLKFSLTHNVDKLLAGHVTIGSYVLASVNSSAL